MHLRVPVRQLGGLDDLRQLKYDMRGTFFRFELQLQYTQIPDEVWTENKYVQALMHDLLVGQYRTLLAIGNPCM